MNLQDAYNQCERITEQQARNFSYGIKLLPRGKRQALSAVYAFARRVDDIGDGQLAGRDKLAELAAVHDQLHDLPHYADDPVLLALDDAVHRHGLPLSAFDDLIEGCRADVLGATYRTFDQLRRYCGLVAGSIGRLCLAVFSPDRQRRHEELADALGVALQLTNILRDLLEDRRMGRIYLPTEDLDRFGCTLELDQDRQFTDGEDPLAALVEYQAARAEEWYAIGLRLLPELDGRSRACCAAMAGIYHRLLRRIALRPWQVVHERVRLPPVEKATVAALALTGGDA
ncbi:presqualene diphosphate synthase HpnD [Kutzneria viridogrisea]|uniref:Phytoene synthase n=1 Tax=Kutzneria viridogrisea TaxID=47990 RepID=A0ABR6BUS0_9PSEU|nr:phytoene synthase [Kutzneria viridogrisea]